MSARTTVSTGYRVRLIIIGLACLGWAAWCVKDGFYTYPRQAQEHAALQDFKEANPDDWNTAWPEYARANGWSEDIAAIKPRSDFDIYTQYIMLAITGPLGLIFAFRAITSGGWWVEADDDGIRSHGGRAASWSEVTDVDRTRWKSKGIAYVKIAGGQRILLDDWKYERQPTQAVMEIVEEHLGLPEDEEVDAETIDANHTA
ncbi:hypothetical protein [Mucisphaera sp.]|uniref:hypothetical protein n=1 Tax=Mucisphaera sp. TaxID=2913024 RepID=UPI003D14A432